LREFPRALTSFGGEKGVTGQKAGSSSRMLLEFVVSLIGQVANDIHFVMQESYNELRLVNSI